MAEAGELPPINPNEVSRRGGPGIGRSRIWRVNKRGEGWQKIRVTEKVEVPGVPPRRTIENLGPDETR